MSGRGRGRGRGRAPPTGGRAFLMRSADECGLDSRNLRSLQDITRPALFPDILLHSSGDKQSYLEEEQRRQQQEEEQAAKAAATGGAINNNNNNNNTDNTTVGVKVEGGNIIISTTTTNAPKKITGIKRSSQTLFLITKGREIHHRIQHSAFHVKPSKDVPDVIRYAHSTRPQLVIDASTVLSHCLRGQKRTKTGRYVPEELVSGQTMGSSNLNSSIEASIAAGRAVSLNDDWPRQRSTSIENAEDGGGEEDDEIEDQGSEDDGEDYVADHYASGDDDSGGGDNEPTF